MNNVNTSVGNISVGEEEYNLYGKSTITEILRGLTFQISTNSFFQTDTRQVIKREKMAKLREQIVVQKAKEKELNRTIHITEETMRAKQMLATMSREIRSPLTGVVGMAEILANTKLDKEQCQLLDVMVFSGDLVLQLINDILDLSKVESAGPKEWLKDQKKKASNFVLAPINASRQSLHTAFSLLMAMDSESSTTTTVELQRLLKSAGRDCVPLQRNSFVAFQAQTGVEVCTFRLIVKNASSLLDDKDPVKLEAEAMLDDLIRSFTFLNDVVCDSNLQIVSNRQKLKDGLMDTIASIDKFEKGIKDCLNV